MKLPGITLAVAVLLTALAATALGQTPVARDDAFGVPFATALVVESPGVLGNDTGSGGAVLVSGVGHGVLECASDPDAFDLCPDGSFTYTPDATFTGFDVFTYQLVTGSGTSQATVTLDACTGGPTVIVCWQEAAFLARLGEIGYSVLQEGFEDDAVWGMAREPFTEPWVVSQGVRWESNHADPPASNELTTGDGAARTGLWGLYDPEHGYATGTAAECDINDPPVSCLLKDGFTGTLEPGGATLYAAGGHFRGLLQPGLVMILDGGPPIGLGRLVSGGHQFFGVIDLGGFTSFRTEETDGKVGQARLVFGDDFVLGTAVPDVTPPRVTLVGSSADTGDGELAEGEITGAAITQLLVGFDEPLRDLGETVPGSVTNPASFLLVGDGGNGFETVSCSAGVAGNDVATTVNWVSWAAGSERAAVLGVNGGLPLAPGSYRLHVCGDAIADWAANLLDGNGDGSGGDDLVRGFAVNGAPAAVADTVTVAEGGVVTVLTGGASSVLDNDLDPELDPLTAVLVTGPSRGLLSFNPDGTFSYVHDGGETSSDLFTYRATDAYSTSNVATVSVTVTPVNDAPVAAADGFTVDEDSAGNVLDVLANDGDAEGGALTVASVGAPSQGGSVAIAATTDHLVYTPAPGFVGTESFSYTASDGLLGSNAATVTVTVSNVNDPPAAVADGYATDEDTVLTVAAPGVLGNDSDADGDPLSAVVVGQPSSGTLTLAADGSFSYTPDADFNGADAFTYRAGDGTLQSAVTTVSIAVTAVNDAPAADAGPDQNVSVTDAVLLDGTGSTDVDGDPLGYAWSLVAAPAGSTAALSDPAAAGPSFVADLPGSYTAQLIVNDGAVASAPDTVVITASQGTPSISIADASVVEGDAGVVEAWFVVTLSVESTEQVTVGFSTTEDTAVAGVDFVPAAGSVVFPPHSLTQSLSVDILGDLAAEPDETFLVELTGPVGATVADAQAVGTIVDDDPWTWYVAPLGSDSNDCTTPLTPCRTLGEAVARASSGDTLEVAAGTYPETLDLTSDMTVNGSGRGTVLDGSGAAVVVSVASSAAVAMTGLEIRNGAVGGLEVLGSLTLRECWIHGNGTGAAGTFGGIANAGAMVVDSCAVSGNHGQGSAAVKNSGQLDIVNTSVFGNLAATGAAIDNLPGGVLDLSWVTVSGNGAVGVGGGGAVTVEGTILSGHSTANCSVPLTSLGHNLEDADTCGLSLAMADRIGVDPLLTSPSTGSWWTPSLRPGPGSPAVDAAASPVCPASDQRGVARPLDGDEDGTAACDAGAVEVDPAEHPLFSDGFESGDTALWSAVTGGS